MSELRQAVHRAAKQFPGGIEALAGALSRPGREVDARVLRNRLVGNDRHHLTVELAEEIIDLCHSDELAHAAARQRLGAFISMPVTDTPSSDLAVLDLVTKVWSANGEVGRAVDETLADGRVDKAEIAMIRRSIYKVQQAMMTMLSRLEDMAE